MMACCHFLLTIKIFLVERTDPVYYRYCGVDVGVDVVVDMVVDILIDGWLIIG